MHSAHGVPHLLSGKTKSLLRHFAWKEAARKKYAVRAAGIFHKIYSRKRNLFRGRSEWRQGMFVAVFLLLFFSAVSIFLSRHFFLLTLTTNYLYTTSAIFVQNLIKFGWQFSGNWMDVQFKVQAFHIYIHSTWKFFVKKWGCQVIPKSEVEFLKWHCPFCLVHFPHCRRNS